MVDRHFLLTEKAPKKKQQNQVTCFLTRAYERFAAYVYLAELLHSLYRNATENISVRKHDQSLAVRLKEEGYIN